MKIYISAPGKFDLFRWAEGFEKRGLLGKIFTDFYSKKDKTLSFLRRDVEDISPDKVVSFPWPRLLRFFLGRIFKRYEYWEGFWFDIFVSRKTKGADLIIVRSSCALNTILEAKKNNTKTVLYRGSSHILFQDKILFEERELWNLPQVPISKDLIELERKEYVSSDFIFVPSSFAAKTYINQGLNPSKIINFPLSVKTQEKNKEIKKIYKDRLSVVYLGNISLRKGIQYLIRVANFLKTAPIDFYLAGSIEAEFKCMLKKLPDNFNLLGKIPNYKIANLYNKGDVFVLPSIEDGFGQVILEAMSMGLPVITTENTGGPDVIENGKEGFILPIRNVDLMVEKLVYFSENREICLEMGRLARKKSSQFTVDKFIENWELVIKEKILK